MVKLGIIGGGSMAAYHAKKFSRIPGVTIASVCDRDSGKAGKIAADFPNCRTYTRIRDMLHDEKLHGVSIATIDSHHAEASQKCIEAGTAVFCEKPLASSQRDAEQLSETVLRKSGLFMLNLSKRNIPAVSGAADAVNSGAIGSLIHIRLSYLQSWYLSNLWGVWKESPRWLWRLCSSYGTGGVIGDLGAHLFDLLVLFAGTCDSFHGQAVYPVPETVTAGRDRYDIDSPVLFEGVFSTKQRVTGSLTASICTPAAVNSLSVTLTGTSGRIELDLEKKKDSFLIHSVDGSRDQTIFCQPVPSTYERFIRMIRTGVPDELDIYQGLRVQKFIDAACRSITHPRDLPDQHKLHFPEMS